MISEYITVALSMARSTLLCFAIRTFPRLSPPPFPISNQHPYHLQIPHTIRPAPRERPNPPQPPSMLIRDSRIIPLQLLPGQGIKSRFQLLLMLTHHLLRLMVTIQISRIPLPRPIPGPIRRTTRQGAGKGEGIVLIDDAGDSPFVAGPELLDHDVSGLEVPVLEDDRDGGRQESAFVV